MVVALLSTTLFFLAATKVALADLVVPTIQLSQCQTATITFSGGVGPYDVAVVPGGDTCGDVVAELGTTSDTTISWPVNVPAGTVVSFSVWDNGGGPDGWSGSMTVGDSGDSSCLPSAAASTDPTTSSSSDGTTGDDTNSASSSSSAGSASPSSGSSSSTPPTTPAVNSGSNPSSGSGSGSGSGSSGSTGGAAPIGAAGAGIINASNGAITGHAVASSLIFGVVGLVLSAIAL